MTFNDVMFYNKDVISGSNSSVVIVFDNDKHRDDFLKFCLQYNLYKDFVIKSLNCVSKCFKQLKKENVKLEREFK